MARCRWSVHARFLFATFHASPNRRLMRRFSVKPGLTGLWQINGRSDTNFSHWIALDLEYIDRWSLALDFRILAEDYTGCRERLRRSLTNRPVSRLVCCRRGCPKGSKGTERAT